ncbi:HU family DNA-binding protein [Candidatus Azambacteria bacterium]|nr:HU family DNA-binding protein [Candidatus Azambacteria bacterium]
MNKDALAEAVQSKAGLDTKKSAQDAVDAVFDTISAALSKGDEVSIAGFGSFKTDNNFLFRFFFNDRGGAFCR